MPGAPLLLQVTGLRKNYNVPVLRDVCFELRAGEVHALVGGNGAGKSTFARILCGLTERDGGEISFRGQPYLPATKREAERAGVVMVLQELNVIGALSVAENIFLNDLPQRGGFVRFAKLQEKARRALSHLGMEEIDPAQPAGRLGVGHQQLVEIAGALAKNCQLLILDEPTAALTVPEIERLFENIRRLQAEGVGIIYVSHRMEEIRQVANRVSVLRDGQLIATRAVDEVTAAELIREMAGHDLPERGKARERSHGPVALRVRNLRSGGRARQVSFDVRRGEILGLSGLIGSGRTETLRAVFGADAKEAGEVFVDETLVMIRAPSDAVRVGIGLIPEDRKQDALLLSQSVRVNTTLSALGGGWLNPRAETATAAQFTQRLQVRCHSLEQAVGELSGGNQQKVVIARWLARDCRILLFDEPTRGVDVAAKDAIHQLLRELAGDGKALVVVSSELTELMSLCDRILVMSAGQITGEFRPGDWTREKITDAAFRGYSS
ncbi:MAG TPA: sugar ABC transporter ATP-binding protein [Candidatus Saccharimonadales bacterium]|nr:sugar ABC transporter ATP-binding protein [Candidatus Saccharimonadales bacterium]